MLRIPTMLMMLVPIHAIDISIIDSKVNPKISYVMVDDCAAPVLKSKLSDYCYVEKFVNDFCHLDIELTGCKTGGTDDGTK